MSKSSPNILIIENQQHQYEAILSNIESHNNYSAFPATTNYIAFIDNVRVWVNEKYLGIRDIALKNIYNEIVSNDIDIILMDHILGGAYHCYTGIDLADEINLKLKGDGKDTLPIIFLSRTVSNDKRKNKPDKEGCIGYLEFEKKYEECTDWIQKGIFGEQILLPKYFNEYVINKIEELIPKNQETLFYEKAKNINTKGSFNSGLMECKDHLSKIINKDIEYGDNEEIDSIIISHQITCDYKKILNIREKIENALKNN